MDGTWSASARAVGTVEKLGAIKKSKEVAGITMKPTIPAIVSRQRRAYVARVYTTSASRRGVTFVNETVAHVLTLEPDAENLTSSSLETMAKGLRLDLALVQRGLFATRQKAQAAIMAGEVQIDGRLAAKASDSVRDSSELAVTAREHYVGRGGTKLEGAVEHFRIDCAGKVALDIGASTGGFTDCLLQKGASKVFAVDVGHGQLDWKIRGDSRVVTLEKTNARHLSREHIPEPIAICVIDVSFISLTLILPKAFGLLTPDGVILALIKPQFELARADVGRGGIVRDPQLHAKVQKKISDFSRAMGAQLRGLFPSTITGTDGNQEFFICLQRSSE